VGKRDSAFRMLDCGCCDDDPDLGDIADDAAHRKAGATANLFVKVIKSSLKRVIFSEPASETSLSNPAWSETCVSSAMISWIST
jgi:hypothetical protein